MKISYYIMRRYYISQRSFITFRAPCAITFRENFVLHYAYYISQQFFFTSCVGVTFRNTFYYIMRRYYISQRFCKLRYALLHFATILYYAMRRYYISFITFMRFNRRTLHVCVWGGGGGGSTEPSFKLWLKLFYTQLR